MLFEVDYACLTLHVSCVCEMYLNEKYMLLQLGCCRDSNFIESSKWKKENDGKQCVD